MKVIVEIELGNAAMADEDELASALTNVSFIIRHRGIPQTGDSYAVIDDNGNTVGKAYVADDDIADCNNCNAGERCYRHNPPKFVKLS